MANRNNPRSSSREGGRERMPRGGRASATEGMREQEDERSGRTGQMSEQGRSTMREDMKRMQATQGMQGHGQEWGLARQALASPFSFMRRFSEEMDRLFEDFGFGRGWLSPSMGEFSPSGLSELGRAAWSPQVEMFRRGDELVVRADLPGMRREDVRVDVQQDHLVIQGERTWETDEDREGVMRSERRYGSFHRRIPLPAGVRAEDTRASYRDGVLEITMPAPEERGRRIQIED